MGISDARRRKAFDEEDRKLKKILAKTMRDVATLREALGKLLTPGAHRKVESWTIEEKGCENDSNRSVPDGNGEHHASNLTSHVSRDALHELTDRGTGTLYRTGHAA